MFKLISSFKPTGDQPQAIAKLSQGVKSGLKNQVLLGVTGSGKTFTIANVIRDLNMPALIISHNKTLAGQLYQEMRDFFPENGVSYFVSYYDFYQPEAYIPQSDTYIEKEADINEMIDKLRLQSTTNIMTRPDSIVVASVSCIYNIGSPVEYGRYIVEINIGNNADWLEISRRLVDLQYDRSEFEFKRGTFRLRGNYMDIYPAYEDFGYRVFSEKGKVIRLLKFEPITGKKIGENQTLEKIIIYPAKHYLTNPEVFASVEKQIRYDLKIEHTELKNRGKLVEAQRLMQKVNYDLEMIKEVGYVNGIENYSRYLDGRRPGDPPYSLLDYFKRAYGDNFLVFIDESHMTVPQLRGMYNGDQSRKRNLIEFGFRLRAAYDNRPLKFDEFYRIPPNIIYTSATPDEWEISMSKSKVQNAKLQIKNQKWKHDGVVEQLVRPTGIIDPKITIRPAKDEITDLIVEIEKRVKLNQKILVTTLTKKTAEDLSGYLREKSIKAEYLHSDVKTLERSDVLDNLRKGQFDVLIGVNLLREGLDLPEVYLVAILDGDKEGFLRSKTALIQTMGRAARNVEGEVIIYADRITDSIKFAIAEIDRRRKYQVKYNKANKITPLNIIKPIRVRIAEKEEEYLVYDRKKTTFDSSYVDSIRSDKLTPFDRRKIVKKLEREMKREAMDLNFEMAIKIREKVKELKGNEN